MVRLFRGARGRGRGVPIPPPPLMMPRHMRPHDYEYDYEPDYVRPSDYVRPYPPAITLRGHMLRGHPVRAGPPRPHLPPPPPPRMRPPPLAPPPPIHLPIPPHQPIHPRLHPLDRPIPGRRPPLPPPMHPGPPLRRPIRPVLPLARGRGLLRRGRGVPVKRLGVTANGRTKKNRRKEKTEGDFYCETCDRSWKTLEKLEAHQAEHQTCGRDGCTFTAHPKLILKHVQVQHDSGLYNRIVFTQDPAEVAKWIAERKSRFPTKGNVEKKQAQAQEMMKRGERIPTHGKPFQNKGRFANQHERRERSENFNKPEAASRQKRAPRQKFKRKCEDDKWRDPDAWKGDLPQFPGTAAFPCEKDDVDKDIKEVQHISDDEDWTEKNSVNKEIEKPFVSNILSSLMISYGSDMSDDDGDGDITPQKAVDAVLSTSNKPEKDPTQKLEEGNSLLKMDNDVKEDSQIILHNDEDSDSGPEECAIDRENTLNIPASNSEKDSETKLTESKSKEPINRVTERAKAHVQPPMKRYQLTLLEKLLKNEIRQERNAILQCVRYVVKNNFLGCGSDSKSGCL